MRLVFMVLISLAFAGCGHGSGSVGDVSVGAGCPALKRYSKREQSALRIELNACKGKCKQIAGALSDYYVLRQQVRACRKRR